MLYSRKVQRLHRDRQILDHSVDFPARNQSESPLEQRMVLLFVRLLLCFAMVCHLASLYMRIINSPTSFAIQH